jgi:hypothetical protein
MAATLSSRAPLLSARRIWPLVAAAVVLAGCGRMNVSPRPSGLASLPATTPEPVATPTRSLFATPGPTLTPRPSETSLAFLPGFNGDQDRAIMTSIGFQCRDGNGAADAMWTCSYHNEVDVTFYGPSPERVSAYRVVTTAVRGADRRSWLRWYSDALGTEVWQWVSDHTETNDSTKVGGVCVQMTHDPPKDGTFISAAPIRP